MPITLPAIIETYFEANNAHDTAVMAACFAEDAVVNDEGGELRGTAAIAEWIYTTTEKYQSTVAVTDLNKRNAETIVTGQVSGNFDGSPIQLQYHFIIKADKIAALTIRT